MRGSWRALLALAATLAALAHGSSTSSTSSRSSSFPAAGEPFRYRSYAQTAAYLLELNATFPEVLRVSVAQETYDLPYPEELTCIVDDESKEEAPCKHYVVHLTNHSTLAADQERPEVFISGALHGNERVGPVSTVELLALLAKFSTWFAHPEKMPADAKGNVSVDTLRWAHTLVNTRNVLSTPMTNAWGISHNKREELDVDPNRDYNYMRSGDECMTTMTSRVVNEIWRDHIFQMAITFHGGTRAVSYEWGSPDHYVKGDSTRSEKSPDHTAQFQLANTFATFAGAFHDGTLYPTGTMNDIVYGVTGGMEDWAYAASWENEFYKNDKPFKPCSPKTFGGYPEEKTVYGSVTHRAFNMLVETSNKKEPKESDLGEFDDLYRTNVDFFHATDGIRVGHVTQNVRLALMMIEMVQPFVRWVDSGMDAFNQSTSVLSAFPSAARYVSGYDQVDQMGCGASSSSAEPPLLATCSSLNCTVDLSAAKTDAVNLQLSWEVLGSLTIDKTNIQVATSPKFEAGSIILETTEMSGISRRFFEFASDQEEEKNLNAETLDTSMFMACLEFDELVSGEVFVRAKAIVDQDWAYQGIGSDNPSPDVPPQSHMVNARTNPKWDMQWNGHRVKASLEWFSPVISVSFVGGSTDDSVESDTEDAASGLGNDTTVGDNEALVIYSPTPSIAVANATSIPNDTITIESTALPDDSSVAEDDEDEDALELPVVITAAPTATPRTVTKAPVKEVEDDDEIEEELDELDAELDAEDGDLGSSDEIVIEEADEDEEDEDEGYDDDDDDVEETSAPTSVPAATTATTSEPSSDIDGGEALAALQRTDDDSSNGPSLLTVGYAVLGTGGIVMAVIMALLYRRVFRRRRQPYESLNAPRASPSSPRQGRRASVDLEDDDDDDEEDP